MIEILHLSTHNLSRIFFNSTFSIRSTYKQKNILKLLCTLFFLILISKESLILVFEVDIKKKKKNIIYITTNIKLTIL